MKPLRLFVIGLMSIATSPLVAAPTDDFVTTWKTDNPGTTNQTSITVPMMGGPYDVDWDNDGFFDQFGITDAVTHDFGVAGTYTIRIFGSYDSIRFAYGGDKDKILSLDQWGTGSWTSMESAFHGTLNLLIPATDTPDFSVVTDMSRMFYYATSANPDTSDWDTSSVTHMHSMFMQATSANPDTSGWNTSVVTDMSWMFSFTSSANPDTSGWDTSSVTNMSNMFYVTYSANPDTSGWDTSSVTNMSGMFGGATSANPDTSGWDTSAATDMSGMFGEASGNVTPANPDTSDWDTSAVTAMNGMFFGSSANPDTSGWDTSSVTNMSYMFHTTYSANPDTSGWDISSVTNMSYMFYNATTANPNTSGWDTSSVLSMPGMFYNATSANPDTSGWDTSVVTDIRDMFYKATSANPDTSGWDTSSVMGMSGMFYSATSANPDTSGWDTSVVTDTVEMFRNAVSFDQDLGSWNVSSLGYAARMFDGVTLSTANYESLLISWNAQTLQSSVTFSGGSSKYCSAAAITARANMVESDAWIITDGGNDCTPVFKINAGLNDAWFYEPTSGQGFFITVFTDLGYVSLAWFTYDTELPPIDATANLGDPGHRWLTAVGPIEGNQVLMNIEMTSGGIFDSASEIIRTDPPGSDGTIILTFDSCNSGTVEYDIPSINRQGIVPIERVAGDNIVICEALQN